MTTYFPTSHIATVTDYPYGRLQCTIYFGTEFVKGKGFRSTQQTINPKTGRLNAIKKSTYSPILVMYQDEVTGYYRHAGLNPNSDEGVNKCLDFIRLHFDLFTPAELSDIAAHLVMVAKAGLQATVTYCGADAAKVIEMGGGAIRALVAAYKEPTRENFEGIRIDSEGLKALHVPDFKPFTIRGY